jgi:gluconate 2-dehydrogenase gamma chain
MNMDFDRRSLLQSFALLLGASALPVEALAAVPRGKRFLTAATYKLLSAVAETIVPTTDTPGAIAAGVPAKLDYMLGHWASAMRKKELLGALAAIDTSAIAQLKKHFAKLNPAQRYAVLFAHDKAALKPAPKSQQPLSGIAAAFGGEPSVVDPDYRKLKELIVALYYNSEIGATRELTYEHVPGGWTPSLKVTPETRPWASVGPF